MATLTENRFAGLFRGKPKPAAAPSKRIYAFAEELHARKGGPNEKLVSVYRTYVDSRKKRG